ncbi:hypothetical protein H2LOC_018680 [Methylocystis heyeri]|uniref:L,D-TPase catalytic domain-containing protein n=1 Tax=Methylocystis heyeri TaxID=391905 RepID=A0A6B8KLR4_9HYPH|nr:hypothetical protein H2LOC_018680 [Methylocystis heyeri]
MPPRRPANLADLSVPLPPPRPVELSSPLAAPSAEGGAPAPQANAAVAAPEAPAAVVAAPAPPSRPRDLAASLALVVPQIQNPALPVLQQAAPPQQAAPLQQAAPPQETRPPAPAVAAPLRIDAPLPPARPRSLAALTPAEQPATEKNPAPAVPTPQAPAAASAPAQQVAALSEPVLRPAPEGSFNQPDQPPARFNMGAPVYIRIFKKEGELELWLKHNGRYALYRSFPICKWSGRLGPKLREADYQSPEGFYSVSARQLHPHSNYHRAFNVGYPNAYDRQNGRTGGLVMVHGNCKSVGCFAMTDKGIEEIYGFVEAALAGGQREVPIHIFPFRMTEAAIARESSEGGFMSFLATEPSEGARWAGFWRNLKEGYEIFQQTGEPPTAYACGDHYSFDAAGASCKRIAGW